MGLKWKSSSLTSSSLPSELLCIFSTESTECVTASAGGFSPQMNKAVKHKEYNDYLMLLLRGGWVAYVLLAGLQARGLTGP